MIFFAVLVLPVLTDESRAAWIRSLARIVPSIMGVRVKVSGGIPDEDAVTLARRQGKTGYMICSNHISFLDIFLLDSILPVRFVAKKEIESWPVFGLISKRGLSQKQTKHFMEREGGRWKIQGFI